MDSLHKLRDYDLTRYEQVWKIRVLMAKVYFFAATGSGLLLWCVTR